MVAIEPAAPPLVPKSIFVLGGVRSGKSRFAQRLALHLAKDPVYLATSRIYDDDHRQRIERHRKERGPEWTTIEEPEHLSGSQIAGRVVVVDCLTLWLNNCFMSASSDPDRTLDFVNAELDRLFGVPATLILVSNEIGQGVHAATEIGRRFTDLQGLLNQLVAARADNVMLMIAGLAQQIKGRLPEGAPLTAR
jgi:adenosylcobinamide kinase / adenosylcobinamide-phosphate guanylyltransferase